MKTSLREISHSLSDLPPELLYLLIWLFYGLPWFLLIKTLKGRMRTVIWLYVGTFIAGLALFIQFHIYELNQIAFVIIVILTGAGIPMVLLGEELKEAGFPTLPTRTKEAFLSVPGVGQLFALLFCLYLWSGIVAGKLSPRHFGKLPVKQLYDAGMPVELKERPWIRCKKILLGLSTVLFGSSLLFLDFTIVGYALGVLGILIGATAFLKNSTLISMDGLTVKAGLRKPRHIPWEDIVYFERLPEPYQTSIKVKLNKANVWTGYHTLLQNNYGYDPEELSKFLNDSIDKIGSGGGT